MSKIDDYRDLGSCGCELWDEDEDEFEVQEGRKSSHFIHGGATSESESRQDRQPSCRQIH